MRIFFDTEFYENGRTIDLISIGMVRADGKEYYAETEYADRKCVSDWLQANVKPHLRGGQYEIPIGWMRKQIGDFAGDAPEFWADYASYDWVVLCQLFGTMMQLPKGWPMFCRDVQQLIDQRGAKPLMPPNPDAHNALADAKECKAKYDWLTRTAG